MTSSRFAYCCLLFGFPSLWGQNIPLPSAPVHAPLLTSTEPDKAPLDLTLQDAVTMASRRNPQLQEAEAVTQKATAALKTARAYSNPTLEIYQGRQYKRPISTPGVPGLLQHYGGSQAIEIPAERHARIKTAQSGITSSQASQRGTMLSVIADAKHSFYNALRRREEVKYEEENLKLVADLLRRIEVEVRVGEKGRLELTRAQAELAGAQFNLSSAQIEYKNSIALLRASIAASPDANLEPRGDLDARITLEPVEQLRQKVLNTHPAIAQAQANIESSKAALEQQKLLRIPQPVLFAEFENQPDLRFWRAGINIPLPLGDRRRGQIAEAQATISQSNAILHQRYLELISALERAYEQYQLADQQLLSLQAGALHAAETAVEAAKAAYRYGERGIVEVLDAQRVLQIVREDLVNAQYARQSALIDLQELGAVAPGVTP